MADKKRDEINAQEDLEVTKEEEEKVAGGAAEMMETNVDVVEKKIRL